MMEDQECTPFGDEWAKEISKFPKAEIIKMLQESKIILKKVQSNQRQNAKDIIQFLTDFKGLERLDEDYINKVLNQFL